MRKFNAKSTGCCDEWFTIGEPTMIACLSPILNSVVFFPSTSAVDPFPILYLVPSLSYTYRQFFMTMVKNLSRQKYSIELSIRGLITSVSLSEGRRPQSPCNDNIVVKEE